MSRRGHVLETVSDRKCYRMEFCRVGPEVGKESWKRKLRKPAKLVYLMVYVTPTTAPGMFMSKTNCLPPFGR